jgi:hypothetical protein
MRGIDDVEQSQLRALCSFFGVCQSHPKASLWSEMDMPIVWMARVRCIVFWFKVSMTEAFQGRGKLPVRLLGTRVLGLEISTQPWNNFIGLMWLEMTGMGCHVQK